MEWQIDYDSDREMLRIVARGDITLESLQAMAAEALPLLARYGASAVLVDHRQSQPAMSTLEIYQWPAQLAQMGLQKSVRIAIVHASEEAQARDFHFYEGASCLLGMTHLGFTDIEAAITWLSHPPEASAERTPGQAKANPVR